MLPERALPPARGWALGDEMPSCHGPWLLAGGDSPNARTDRERASLRGALFQEVEKARIVAFSWEHWDRSGAAPEEYPESSEPESYILGRPHDEALAEAMGLLCSSRPSV